MRVIAEADVGHPQENVIGSAAEYEYEDGALHRGDEVLGGLALGPGKPEHIFASTGRLPAFAGGNADVDIEMLEAATSPCWSSTTTPSASSPTPRPPKVGPPQPVTGWTLVSI